MFLLRGSLHPHTLINDLDGVAIVGIEYLPAGLQWNPGFRLQCARISTLGNFLAVANNEHVLTLE